MDDRREPSGQRFVILRHETPTAGSRPSHWDLMLEHGGALLTWELPTLAFPSLPGSFEQLNVQRLADHRLHYLEYEGPLSNNRGSVQRIDAGRFHLEAETSTTSVRVRAEGRVFRFALQLPKATFHHLAYCAMAASTDAELPELTMISEQLPSAGNLLSFETIRPANET